MRRPLRSRARRAFALATAGVLASAGVLSLAGTADAATTLGAPAAAKGRYFGTPSWDSGGNVMTMRPNGNGSLAAGASVSFGLTVMTNGNTSAPAVGACTAS